MKWKECDNGGGLLYLLKHMTLGAGALEQQALTSLAPGQHY